MDTRPEGRGYKSPDTLAPRGADTRRKGRAYNRMVSGAGSAGLSIALLCCSITLHVVAQNKAAEIDSLMQALASRGQFNGSVLVAEHGEVIYEKGFGTADIEHGIPFAPSTPCYLASLAKQFTAMGVMILAEQHRLALADPLSKYFSEFSRSAPGVAIRHLLTHTSGMPDYVRMGLEHPGLTNDSVMLALERADSMDFPAGSRFQYSNSGYIVLAKILEKVSGKRYRDFLKERIFDPLGMSSTLVCDESRPGIPGHATGYGRFGDLDDYNLFTYGEGGIYSSVEDLFKWDQALYTEKLVRSSTLEEAFAKPALNDGSASSYGFGWAIGEYDGQKTTSHAGRYGGFDTYIKRFTKDRNAVIFLTNHGFRNMSAIGGPLINILYGKPYALPKLSIAEAMFGTYKYNGISKATVLYRLVKGKNDTTYDFGESELNELGYELLGKKLYPAAIEILKMNAEQYPSSPNVYDGLGEAYMDNGDRELAIQNYRKELELDPGNQNAVSMLKKLGVN